MLESGHENREELARLFRGETAEARTVQIAEHLFKCKECWSLAVEAIAEREAVAPLRFEAGPLGALVELYKLEQRRLEGNLAAQAALLSIRNLDRKQRRDKIRLTRSFHTIGFLELLLSEARGAAAPPESEEFAYLALVVAQQLPTDRFSTWMKNDIAAECCAEIANARRRSARWQSAREALRQGSEYVRRGSGNPAVEGKLLSVAGAVEGDLGQIAKAEEVLRRAITCFETAPNWTLLSRTLVQLAYVLVDSSPEQSLILANKALATVPQNNQRLVVFAESIRVDCLIALGAHREALRRFESLAELYEQFPEPFIQLRRKFTAGRILEGLGQLKNAEAIFNDVIAGDLEQGLIKNFFLDLIYLFGALVKEGKHEDALKVCQRALDDLPVLEIEEAAQNQMRQVWEGLAGEIRRGTLTLAAIAVSRDYIKTNWRTPAADLPSFRDSTR
jgi:tetratricopeptide (TPR) repeat protein